MTAGLLVTALILGLRHGVDWDHIAAIADLSGAADDRRRGFRLSFLYAAGHAVVVFALGCLAIVAGSSIPDGLDRWMGRIVGLTLIWLGIWVLVELMRHGRDFRLRSRWMLVLDGTFAGLRRVARPADRRLLEVEHEHEHEHAGESPEFADGVEETPIGGHGPRHRHGHRSGHRHGRRHGDPANDVTVEVKVRHSHRHRHVIPLPDRLGTAPGGAMAHGTGAGTAAGIGMVHGVGVESPTQIAVFVASTSVVGWTAGLGILAAWCVGLVLANSGLAVLAGFGLLEARRNFALYATIAVLVAVGSIVMGTLYLFELDALPSIAP